MGKLKISYLLVFERLQRCTSRVNSSIRGPRLHMQKVSKQLQKREVTTIASTRAFLELRMHMPMCANSGAGGMGIIAVHKDSQEQFNLWTISTLEQKPVSIRSLASTKWQLGFDAIVLQFEQSCQKRMALPFNCPLFRSSYCLKDLRLCRLQFQVDD